MQMYINQTVVKYFIIIGISDVPELKITVFVVVLFIYLITLGGNMAILVLIFFDPHLHMPMYFFLANLSFIDMSCTTVTLHKILISFITEDKTISFYGCMTQTFFFGALSIHELYILSAMSYDRYMAICNPLTYHLIMTYKKCALLSSFCWAFGFILGIPLVGLLSTYSCYTSIEINHFLCDIVPLMKITCSDTSLLDIVFLIEGLLFYIITPFLLTFVPYIFIIVAIIKIRSSTGRRKAFYTCSSHLTVVIFLYTILISQYLIPSSLDSNKWYALINTAAVPLLNPLIYTVKNRDMKTAFRKIFGRPTEFT